MLRTVALAFSVVGNAALLAAWLGAARVPADAPSASTAALPRHLVAKDLDRWVALGLDEQEARRLLFATREAAALAAIDNPWRRYWESRDPALSHATALARAYAALRQDLELEFGSTAAAMPEFSRAYRPLDAQFEFLSSEQQLALQEMRLRDRGRSAGLDACAAPASLATPPSMPESVVLESFPLEVAFEVALRDSPRAEQLRRSGLELTERQYREAFRLLERLDSSKDLEAHLATRRELEELLGVANWFAISAARDPLFAVVERVVASHGLAAGAATAAYRVLGEIQEELLELRVQGRLDEPASVAAVAAREVERLSAVVGAEVASAIFSAREQFHRQVRSGVGAVAPVGN